MLLAKVFCKIFNHPKASKPCTKAGSFSADSSLYNRVGSEGPVALFVLYTGERQDWRGQGRRRFFTEQGGFLFSQVQQMMGTQDMQTALLSSCSLASSCHLLYEWLYSRAKNCQKSQSSRSPRRLEEERKHFYFNLKHWFQHWDGILNNPPHVQIRSCSAEAASERRVLVTLGSSHQ